ALRPGMSDTVRDAHPTPRGPWQPGKGDGTAVRAEPVAAVHRRRIRAFRAMLSLRRPRLLSLAFGGLARRGVSWCDDEAHRACLGACALSRQVDGRYGDRVGFPRLARPRRRSALRLPALGRPQRLPLADGEPPAGTPPLPPVRSRREYR